MLREPLRQKARIPRGQTLLPQSFPAPIGGWNARDSLAAMAPTDAVTLQNWFPMPTYCEIRGGSIAWATGMTGNGKTLAIYSPLSGTNKMFGMTASGIYDVTAAGAVGAAALVRTNGKHQWVNFGDGTSQWLIACNGVDKPAYYDGATWTAVDNVTVPALTGVTTTNLVGVFMSKGRLFFIEKNKLKFWYLAAGAAGGALTAFDLSGVAKLGGYVMAGATWTVDAGDGPDDRVVFVTSEGEVLVYQGTNPSSAASWALVGVYYVGRPLGRRCFQKYGGDVVLITENGTFPLSAAIQSNAIDFKQALSFKIENAFTAAARSYGSNFGWSAVVMPSREALIVNVPLAEDGKHQQYVMNTITKAWCNFDGWNAEDFAVMNGELYFTSGTGTFKAWTGQADLGANIVAYGKMAFSYFGRPGLLKIIRLFRPILAVNGPLSYLIDVDVDFQDRTISGSATSSVGSAALWDTATWDGALWATDLIPVEVWATPALFPGKAIAGKIQIATKSLTVQWMASEYLYELGGSL